MNSRHRAREVAFQVLYRCDVASHATHTPLQEHFTSLQEDLNHHFEHFSVPDSLQEFSKELVLGTLKDLNSIDELLEKHAVNWKVSRMGFVDRNLLRMAIYEMLHFPEIPHSVTMDEAIELGKQFGTAETPSFINGILDSIAKKQD